MTHPQNKKPQQHSQQESEKENATAQQHTNAHPTDQSAAESGGPSGPEPTRYGDWERKGRCIDF